MTEATPDAQREEVKRNYAEFQKMLPELIASNPGKFALMRGGKVIEFFDSANDAFLAGRKLYADGIFSVQEIADKPVDLGFFSHAFH